MIFIFTNGTQVVFNNKFRNRINMCLQNNGPCKICSTPYFVPAFYADLFKPAMKQIKPESFECDIFKFAHQAYAGSEIPVSNFL